MDQDKLPSVEIFAEGGQMINKGAGSVWERLLVTLPAACVATVLYFGLWGAYWTMVPIWWWRRHGR